MWFLCCCCCVSSPTNCAATQIGQIVTAIPVRLQNSQDTHQFKTNYRSSSGFFSNGPPPSVPATPPPPQPPLSGTDRTDFVQTPNAPPPSQRTITAFSRRKSESIVPHPAATPEVVLDTLHSRSSYFNNPTTGFSKTPFHNAPLSESNFEPPAYAPPPIPAMEPLMGGGLKTTSKSIEGKVTNGKVFLDSLAIGKSDHSAPSTREIGGRGQSGLYLKSNLNLPNEEDLIASDKVNGPNLLNVSSTTGQQKVSDWRKNLSNSSSTASITNYKPSFANNNNYQSPMARRAFESSRSAFEPTAQHVTSSKPRDCPEVPPTDRQPTIGNHFHRTNESDVSVGTNLTDPRKFGYNSFDRASSSGDTNSIDSDGISLVSSNGIAGSEDLSIDHEELYDGRSSGINSRAGSDLTKSDPDIPTSDYLTDDLYDANDHDLSICSDLTDLTNDTTSDLCGKDSLLDYGKYWMLHLILDFVFACFLCD